MEDFSDKLHRIFQPYERAFEGGRFEEATSTLAKIRAELDAHPEPFDEDYWWWKGYHLAQFMDVSKKWIAVRHLQIALEETRYRRYSGSIWLFINAYERFSATTEYRSLICDLLRNAAEAHNQRDYFFSQSMRTLRAALRDAHTLLALDSLARGDLKEALKSINSCFKIKSGDGEYLDVFEHSYEPHAFIYTRAWESDPARYEKRWFESLRLLARKNVLGLEIQTETVKAQLAGELFQQLKSVDPLEAVKRGPANEAWPDALKRYTTALRLLKLESKRGEYDRNQISLKEKTAAAAIIALEQRYQCNVPPTLRQLLTEHGPFDVRDSGDWNHLSLNDDGKHSSVFGGLVKMIEDLWGGRPEFEETFTAEQIYFFNTNFFVYGHFQHDDNAYTHLYFTRDGCFGSIYYHQDVWEDMQIELNALLNSVDVPRYTLDSELSSMIDDLVAAAIIYKEEQQATN
jgi:hypothetical protein